jgi:hypothetical protein
MVRATFKRASGHLVNASMLDRYWRFAGATTKREEDICMTSKFTPGKAFSVTDTGQCQTDSTPREGKSVVDISKSSFFGL